MKNKSFFILFAVLLIIAVILFKYKLNSSKKTGEINISVPVRLALHEGILSATPLIAQKMGFFQQEGLNIQMNGSFGSGKTAFQSMLRGEADISAPATTPVVVSSFDRSDFSIFITFTTTYKGVKIISRRDRNIRKPENLKGKKIGIIPGTISELLITSYLAYNKILIDEVSLIEYKAPDLQEALKSGKVDAVSVWEPFASWTLRELKDNGTAIPTSKVYRMAINLCVMNSFAEKNPEVLLKIIRALDRASDFINSDKGKTQELLSGILELDMNLLNDIWNDYTHRLTLDQQLLITMENEAEWIMKKKFPGREKIPNYLNFIHVDALEKVKPDAVTIIKSRL